MPARRTILMRLLSAPAALTATAAASAGRGGPVPEVVYDGALAELSQDPRFGRGLTPGCRIRCTDGALREVAPGMQLRCSEPHGLRIKCCRKS